MSGGRLRREPPSNRDAIRGPLRDAPLAVCDATTVAFGDFVPSDLVYRDRTGEIYRVKYNPAHRWFYVPDMHPYEAILIKCYDSAPDKARFTAQPLTTRPLQPMCCPAKASNCGLSFFTSKPKDEVVA